MSTNSAAGSDWVAFSQFVEATLGDQVDAMSLEERLASFRAYQRDLGVLRAKIQHSIEQADRGELRELDDAFFAELEREFDRRGIPE
jgi:hypothetical protein